MRRWSCMGTHTCPSISTCYSAFPLLLVWKSLGGRIIILNMMQELGCMPSSKFWIKTSSTALVTNKLLVFGPFGVFIGLQTHYLRPVDSEQLVL